MNYRVNLSKSAYEAEQKQETTFIIVMFILAAIGIVISIFIGLRISVVYQQAAFRACCLLR
jgi:hypothetical protein